MAVELQTLERYFYNDFIMCGKYDIPLVRKQMIDINALKLIRFSSIIKNETKDLDATVHFFEFEYRFDEVWKNPDSYINEIGQYKQTMTPDFSVYTNMSLALQIFNTYRSRWCGFYWQSKGLCVIPTVSWGDERSYDFCFDGIEKNSIVAVSTIGCTESENLFMAGFKAMCDRIEPKQVI